MSRGSPFGLRPDATPLADYRARSVYINDACRGSQKLLKALLRMKRPIRRPRRPKLPHGRYGTWEDRQIAISQADRLQQVVAWHFGVPPWSMTMPTRGGKRMAEARQVAMFLVREIIQLSYPDIARAFNRRDHTTIIHAHETILGRVATEATFAADVKALRDRFGA